MQLKIENLSFSYNKNLPVLKNISYVFNSGFSYILTGENGSGKTTFAKLICGLLKTKNGDIKINNESTKKMNVGKISKQIGYLFQNIDLQLFAPTVIEELKFPFDLTNTLTNEIEDKINNILIEFNLMKIKNNFPLLLSGGEKQRLAIASIFLRDVSFIIFDEPTSSLDKDGIIFLANFINQFVQNDGGILLISHDEYFMSLINEPKKINIEHNILCEIF